MFKHSFSMYACSLMVLALLVTTGCRSVTTPHIAGAPSSEIASAIEGVWKLNDAVVYGQVLSDDKPGQLMFANLNWKKDRFQLGQRVVTVTSIGNAKFLFMGTSEPAKGTDPSKPMVPGPDEQYIFFKLLYQDDKPNTIIAQACDPDYFIEAVKTGKLKGEIEVDKSKVEHVRLSATADELAAYLSDEKNLKDAFLMDGPMVLVRVK